MTWAESMFLGGLAAMLACLLAPVVARLTDRDR